MVKNSFLPLIGGQPHTLILGSLPGDKSLAMQQYYGHPQNRFWKVMQAVFFIDAGLLYADRVKALMDAGVAVWDVAQSAHREGSLDSAMRSETPNRIEELLTQYPTIHTIVFNGQKAAAMYKKHLPYFAHCIYFSMPSTSPANAMHQLSKLIDAWQAIRS